MADTKPGFFQRGANTVSNHVGAGFLWSMGGGTFHGPGRGFELGGSKVMGVLTPTGTRISEWGGNYWKHTPGQGPLPSPAVAIKASDIQVMNKAGQVGSITEATRGQRGRVGNALLGPRPAHQMAAWTAPTGIGAGLAPALGMGFTGLMMYHGYQEDGVHGAMQALYIDVAAGMGVAANQTKYTAMIKQGDTFKKAGMFQKSKATHTLAQQRKFFGSAILGNVGMGIGGYMGAAMGASVGGPIGAAFGGLAGARLARSPLSLAATALAVGGGYMVGKGAYQLLKSGYRRKEQRRGLETSGSLAAFNTRQNITMRQRAVSAIHKSHLNARSALGMEATYMHRNTNYFSTYR